jgi:FlgD Ig-like domain
VRFLPILLVVGLLSGAAAAFAVTESLKLQRSPISRTKVGKLVAPECKCPGKRALVGFRLRKADRVSVAIVNGDDKVVRELLPARHLASGFHVFSWNGRNDDGEVLGDGDYKPRVHLSAAHRTILLPNVITVDTKAPKIAVTHVNLRVISPDRDFKHDYLLVRYRASEDVRALLYANGRLVGKLKRYLPQGVQTWPKTFLGALGEGRYRIVLRGQDRAGNTGPPTRPFIVRVRYIALAKNVVNAPSGGRFSVGVSTDSSVYHWRIGSRHGTARGRVLSLAAGTPGHYVLVVSERGHSDRATLIVR